MELAILALVQQLTVDLVIMPSILTSSEIECKRVWIVDDWEPFSEVLSEVINESRSFKCEECFYSCEAVLRKLKTTTPPDIILLDIGLPGMSGLEGLNHVKAIAPKTKIVVITGREDDDDLGKAMSAQADGFLKKLSSNREIVEALKRVVRGDFPLDPSLVPEVLKLAGMRLLADSENLLTRREKEILTILKAEPSLTYDQVGAKLCISYWTVVGHIEDMFAKLDVASKAELLVKAVKTHLI